MKFQELLKRADRNSVFNIFKNTLCSAAKMNKISYEKEAVLKEKINKLYDDLLSRDISKYANRKIIVCYKYFDELALLEDDKHSKEYYTCSIFNPEEDDDEFYSFIFIAWNEILSMQVCPKSIDDYGKDEVSASILFEMTEMGMNEETKNKNEVDLEKSLLEAEKTAKEGNTISFEDLKRELCIDDTIEENSEGIEKKQAELLAKNKIIKNEFLKFLKNL
ncbi:MAG: hypothetical protein NC548_46745 [Lachnospiraceae bacterium]|nr:hypothetical protein [Lachnospiraceae bacterium]